MKSGNLNFLEPFGPLQACNGTYIYMYMCVCVYVYILLFVCMYVYVKKNTYTVLDRLLGLQEIEAAMLV
jgi:hypothetical protein